MASIDDWAAKAARRIRQELSTDCAASVTEERIAAIVALWSMPLVTALNRTRQECRYSTDDGPCGDCLSCEWNADIDRALAGTKEIA